MTMNITRRLTLAAPLLLLPGCTTNGTGPTAAEIIADLTAMVKTAERIAPLIAPGLAAQIAPWITVANKALLRLSASLPDGTNALTAADVLRALDGVLDVLASAPGVPPSVQPYIAAIAVLMPLIEAWVARMGAVVPTPKAATRAKVMAPAMTAAEARTKVRAVKP